MTVLYTLDLKIQTINILINIPEFHQKMIYIYLKKILARSCTFNKFNDLYYLIFTRSREKHNSRFQVNSRRQCKLLLELKWSQNVGAGGPHHAPMCTHVHTQSRAPCQCVPTSSLRFHAVSCWSKIDKLCFCRLRVKVARSKRQI